MILTGYPIIRCDGIFDILFYDIKGELFPQDHRLACQVEVSVRSLISDLSTLTFTLHPTLNVTAITAAGESLTFDRDQGDIRHHGEGSVLNIHLKQLLQKGEELTFKIDYCGELIAIYGDYYDGYIGEEGIFMRSFAGWYPYCTNGPECYHFPDVPYLLEMRAPAGWTLFAHPDSPEVEEQGDLVVYRWDGRQPHQRQTPTWGIALFGGKYHRIEKNVNGHQLTFFGFDEAGETADKFLSNLGELLTWLDEVSKSPSIPQRMRMAETAPFLQPTYQPTHTQFFSRTWVDDSHGLMWLLTGDEISRWQTLSAVNLDPLMYELGNHLHQMFGVNREETPEGWLAADLEMRLRGYLGIQSRSPQLSLEELYSTKDIWAWWMWHQIVGDEAFYRAVSRLRSGAFPKDAAIGTKEFFQLTSDESGIPVDWFWEQWKERASAPQIGFSQVKVEESRPGYFVEATIHQMGDLYHLPLDIVLRTRKEELRQSIFMRERDYRLAFRCQGEPLELEIDPERKVFKVPAHTKFKPIQLGFYVAFGGKMAWATIMIRDEGLRHGKRLVIVPPELIPVAQALRPYLEKRLSNPPELITADPNFDRNQSFPIPVGMLAPNEVTSEMLKAHNLVLIGTPQNNPLITEYAISSIHFGDNQSTTGEVVIDNPEQGLIALGEHPMNAERFCLHVTGTSNEALQEPPDFTEMPGDYLIYQKGKALKVGYQKPYRLKHYFR